MIDEKNEQGIDDLEIEVGDNDIDDDDDDGDDNEPTIEDKSPKKAPEVGKNLISDQRKIKIKGGKLATSYESESFILMINLDGSTEKLKKQWIYAERKIAFQRIRELMSQKEIDSMISSAPLNDDKVPVVSVLATECGKKVKTQQQIIDDAISAINALPKELKNIAMENLK